MTTPENPKTLPLLSLRNLVLFPGAVMPVEIGRPSSLRLIEALGGKGAHVLVGTQKDADIEEPAGADLYTICVEGEVVRIVKAAENRVTAVLRGLERRRVVGFVQEKPYLTASFEPLTEIRKDPIEIDGLGMAVYDVAKQLIAISPDIPDETAQVLDQHKDPARLTSSPRRSTYRPKSGPRCWSRPTSPSACVACWCCCSARSSSSRSSRRLIRRCVRSSRSTSAKRCCARS
jgi:ATP-dependent Lon protease